MHREHSAMSPSINSSWSSAFILIVLLASTIADEDIPRELQMIQQIDGLEQYVAFHGSNLTVYNVTTSDEWVLEVHRIRNMDIFDPELSTPIYLSHGHSCSSFDFMNNPRNESLIYILADSGFDVWAVNYRSNAFSKSVIEEKKIEPARMEDFYTAAWQDMAEQDFPAIMDLILSETNHSRLHLVGQSMGTTILFAALSENHKYDSVIDQFAAITPVLKIKSDSSVLIRSALVLGRAFSNFLNSISWLHPVSDWIFSLMFGNQPDNEFGVQNKLRSYACGLFDGKLCDLSKIYLKIYLKVLFDRDLTTVFSRNPHLNRERLPIYFNKNPAGTALIAGYDYALQYNKDVWTKIDYDKLKLSNITNMEAYNQSEPPTYDFSKVKVNYSLTYVENDVFTGIETAKETVEELNAKYVKFVEGNRLSHQDTIWGWDARCWVYDDIISTLQNSEILRDEKRHKYQTETVPKYLDGLNLEINCKRV